MLLWMVRRLSRGVRSEKWMDAGPFYLDAVSLPDGRPHGERGRRHAPDAVQQREAGTGAHCTGHLTGKHREAAQGKAACTHTHTHTRNRSTHRTNNMAANSKSAFSRNYQIHCKFHGVLYHCILNGSCLDTYSLPRLYSTHTGQCSIDLPPEPCSPAGPGPPVESWLSWPSENTKERWGHS